MISGRTLAYLYDNQGNQTTRSVPGASDKSWTLTWNFENQLTKMEKIKGTEKRTVTFKYDPLGRRIEKKLTTVIDGVTKTGTTTFVYDGDTIILESSNDGTTTVKTFYTHGQGTDEHLAMERNGQYFYFHADGLGSITAITDASRAVVQAYGYDHLEW
jgi:YD repeat-containing protein